MKKLLLTTMAALTILFAQAQTPCDSITVTGSQNQLTLTSISIIDYWITTAPDGTVLGEDSLWNQHSVFNYNPTGSPYDTIVTCLFTMNTTCCLTYVWNGSVWTVPGGTPTPSWDCAPNTILGCSDPGTGLGQYTSLSSCQIGCSVPCPGIAIINQSTNTFSVSVSGGVAPYTYLWSTGETTQAITVSVSMSGNCDVTDANGCVYSDNYSYSAGQFVACDSMTLFSTGGSPQTILMAEVPFSIMDIHYWITTAPDGTVLGEDSMSNSHQIFNNMNNGQPYDTINVCISYFDVNGYFTCCVTWIWDTNSGVWAKMGSVTSLDEMNLDTKKLIKIVDVLGRETFPKNKQILFYIYEDGTIDKKYIIE
jgi:hypothetical protein